MSEINKAFIDLMIASKDLQQDKMFHLIMSSITQNLLDSTELLQELAETQSHDMTESINEAVETSKQLAITKYHEIIASSEALKDQSDKYPKEWGGMVPELVRLKENIYDNQGKLVLKNATYPCTVDKNGKISLYYSIDKPSVYIDEKHKLEPVKFIGQPKVKKLNLKSYLIDVKDWSKLNVGEYFIIRSGKKLHVRKKDGNTIRNCYKLAEFSELSLAENYCRWWDDEK